MTTEQKIIALKEKSANLTEQVINEINDICGELEYKQASVLSYNIDRLKNFNNKLQTLNLKNYE